MKIWVDDIRRPPEGDWFWAVTSKEVIEFLELAKASTIIVVERISLDHDLGGEDTTRPIVLWMCENEWWPNEVVVHSANPVGVQWLEGMIERYKT